MRKIPVSWDWIAKATEKLAEEITRHNTLKGVRGIYAIPRGGLPIGVMLSHKLKLPLLYHIDKGNCIVVDDICDTGKTMFPYMRSAIMASLFIGNCKYCIPHFWIKKKPKGSWIIFPWELK